MKRPDVVTCLKTIAGRSSSVPDFKQRVAYSFEGIGASIKFNEFIASYPYSFESSIQLTWDDGTCTTVQFWLESELVLEDDPV